MKQQRYVMVHGEVFRWEEKAPFTVSGKSILGAVEVNPETRESRCHECGEWVGCLGRHIALKPGHPEIREYKIRHRLRIKAAVGYGFAFPGRRSSYRPTSEECRKGHSTHRARGRDAWEESHNQRGTCDLQIPFRLQEWAAEHGDSPRTIDLPKEFVHAAIARYGTWKKALVAAGLNTAHINNTPRPRAYSMALVTEMLRDFYVYNKRMPHIKEFGKGRLPSESTVRKIFGTVRAAYEEAGLGLVADGRYHRGAA